MSRCMQMQQQCECVCVSECALSKSSNKCNKNKLQSSSTTPALVMPSHAPLARPPPQPLPLAPNLLPLASQRRSTLLRTEGQNELHITFYYAHSFPLRSFVRSLLFLPLSALLWSGHSATSRGRGPATGGRTHRPRLLAHPRLK